MNFVFFVQIYTFQPTFGRKIPATRVTGMRSTTTNPLHRFAESPQNRITNFLSHFTRTIIVNDLFKSLLQFSQISITNFSNPLQIYYKYLEYTRI